MRWALARGADAVRTGLEDNIRLGKNCFARSNAELVSIAVETIRNAGAAARYPQRSATNPRVGASVGKPLLNSRQEHDFFAAGQSGMRAQ